MTIDEVREWHKTKTALRHESPVTQAMARLTLLLLAEHEAPNHDHDDAQECSRCIARAAVNRILEEMG